jgi:hypothetical protein
MGRVEIDAFGILGYAGVAGCGEQLGKPFGLRQLPRQRILSATRSQQQDDHERTSPR